MRPVAPGHLMFLSDVECGCEERPTGAARRHDGLAVTWQRARCAALRGGTSSTANNPAIGAESQARNVAQSECKCSKWPESSTDYVMEGTAGPGLHRI